jgi:type IV secretory pathway VirB6-like protein
MFYNTYSKGSPNSITQVAGTTLIIYTLYCMQYFVVGSSNYSSFNITTGQKNGTPCFTTPDSAVNNVYIQVYFSSETEPYVGVQVEFTT